jgi:hypothetical protein
MPPLLPAPGPHHRPADAGRRGRAGAPGGVAVNAGLQRLRELPRFLRAPRAAGLWLIGILIPLATLASFVVSFRGLYDWAIHHGWPWYLAPALPLIVDLLSICGEIVLFTAAIDGGTPVRVRVWAWSVTVGFTALSIAGNVSHAATNDLATRIGWGLPPAGIAIALGFGLGELKRQADKYRDSVPPAVPAAAPLPKVREIRGTYGCSQATAEKIRKAMRTRDRVAAAPPETGTPVLPDTGSGLNGSAHG